jgi:hypothetical protein
MWNKHQRNKNRNDKKNECLGADTRYPGIKTLTKIKV